MSTPPSNHPGDKPKRSSRKQAKPLSTILVIVRHGKTPTTGKVLPGRTPGLSLSEEGRAEAQTTAERLYQAYPRPDFIFTSPLERAKETAEPYATKAGVPLIEHANLLECDFGDWTGRDLSELAKLPEWKTVQSTPSRFRFPKGESFPEMAARMSSFMEEVSSVHAGKVVVAYSHADPIKALISDVMGLHLDLLQRVVIHTAAASVIGIVSHQPYVITVNSTAELPRKVF